MLYVDGMGWMDEWMVIIGHCFLCKRCTMYDLNPPCTLYMADSSFIFKFRFKFFLFICDDKN